MLPAPGPSLSATVAALKGSGVLINPSQVSPFPSQPERAIASLEGIETLVAEAIHSEPGVAAATSSVSVDEEANLVTVGATSVPLVANFVAEHFGTSPVGVEPEPMGQLLGYSRFAKSGPVFAGAGIWTAPAGPPCTVGFGARAPGSSAQQGSQDRYFLLAAGHCTGKNSAVKRLAGRKAFAGTSSVGVVRRSALGPESPTDLIDIDATAIRTNEDLATHSVLNGSPMVPQPIQGAMQPKVRRTVCWSGVFGGQHCGRIIKREPYPSPAGGLQYLFLVNGPAASGDSGGPVWDRDAHKAVGLIEAGAGGSWTLPSGQVMYRRMRFTPLLPRNGEAIPEGALPKMGLDILKER